MYTIGSCGSIYPAKVNVPNSAHAPTTSKGDIVDAQDATSDTTVPIDDDERRAWLKAFGYTGDLHERLTLLDREGKPGETAMAADVWCVRRGLTALRTHHPHLFHRLGNWARTQRSPLDAEGILGRDAFGPLTHPVSGVWLPGRRTLVEALLEPNPEDDVFFRFREQPLAHKPQEVAQAA
jgi:hypothetical protein